MNVETKIDFLNDFIEVVFKTMGHVKVNIFMGRRKRRLQVVS